MPNNEYFSITAPEMETINLDHVVDHAKLDGNSLKTRRWAERLRVRPTSDSCLPSNTNLNDDRFLAIWAEIQIVRRLFPPQERLEPAVTPITSYTNMLIDRTRVWFWVRDTNRCEERISLGPCASIEDEGKRCLPRWESGAWILDQ